MKIVEGGRSLFDDFIDMIFAMSEIITYYLIYFILVTYFKAYKEWIVYEIYT